jgi:hypothetical protein
LEGETPDGPAWQDEGPTTILGIVLRPTTTQGKNRCQKSIVLGHQRFYATSPGRWFRVQQASLTLVFLVYGLCQGLPAFGAGEQFYSENVAPKSVEEIDQPMGGAFKKREKPESLFDVWEREGKVSPFPAWLSNQSLDFKARTFYFYQDFKDDSTSEAWALGNWLDYDTG